MAQLLTFLGTGRYDETCYTWQDQQVTTPYVAEALCNFFQPLKVTVFVTEEAKEKHWSSLESRLNNHFSAIPVDIPSGTSENEIWQIFEKVVDSVEESSQILFDITHAFRSIPMLVLLAAAFLQKARNVEIKGVYYGAFEVDRQQPPIFDLTPAIKLLDWLSATDKFITTGSSIELGKLLSTIQQDFYRTSQNTDTKTRPRLLNKLGKRIQIISRSIELVRTFDLMDETAKLQQISPEHLSEELGTFAKPFELLLTQIQQDYGQFALAETDTATDELKKQFLLLRWYTAKKLYAQAMILGREWLISVLCIMDGIDEYRNRDKRTEVEKQLNQMRGNQPDFEQPIAHHVNSAEKLGGFWSKIAEYRNSLAHAQMNMDAINATHLESFVEKQLISDLTTLFPDFVV